MFQTTNQRVMIVLLIMDVAMILPRRKFFLWNSKEQSQPVGSTTQLELAKQQGHPQEVSWNRMKSGYPQFSSKFKYAIFPSIFHSQSSSFLGLSRYPYDFRKPPIRSSNSNLSTFHDGVDLPTAQVGDFQWATHWQTKSFANWKITIFNR